MPDANQDGPSDQELLRRHVAGDSDAFGELFRRHRDRLWAVALRTVCDPDEAADALQDAMVSAFRRAADFRGESAVTTWLHRIVVNASRIPGWTWTPRCGSCRRNSGPRSSWSTCSASPWPTPPPSWPRRRAR